jgi:hypothetical protein
MYKVCLYSFFLKVHDTTPLFFSKSHLIFVKIGTFFNICFGFFKQKCITSALLSLHIFEVKNQVFIIGGLFRKV